MSVGPLLGQRLNPVLNNVNHLLNSELYIVQKPPEIIVCIGAIGVIRSNSGIVTVCLAARPVDYRCPCKGSNPGKKSAPI